MIDYSKLQIEVIKNLLSKGKSVTNKFCYTDDGILLTDSDGVTAILIPKDKFILDTSKFVSNELKSLKDLIKDYLETHGYDVSKADELIEEYESMQTFTELNNGEFEMIFSLLEARTRDFESRKLQR